jgi:hypothetical protein
MQWIAYVLAGLSIVVMGADVVLAVRLHRAIVGGEIGQRWGVLTALLVLSFLGCLLAPLALWFQVSSAWLNVLTLGVALIGAVFIFVAIGIIRDALGFLKLSR